MKRPAQLVALYGDNIYAILLSLVVITIIRNTLELLGLFTGSTNFCCFELNVESYLNTYTYTMLLLFGGIYLVHGVIRGDAGQLRALIRTSTLFMLPLFVLVPLVNLGLNYHGPKIPIWLIPGFYLPTGSLVGFAIILFTLPVYIKRIYPKATYPRIFVALFCGFLSMFLYTYWLGLWAAYYLFKWYAETRFGLTIADGALIQVYSLTFMIPLLVVYPIFARRHIPDQQRLHRWLTSGLVLLITVYLVWDIARRMEALHPSLQSATVWF